ncbi:MAG: cation diffusion facilitator family transporter [Streptosporangiaceae bacterium]
MALSGEIVYNKTTAPAGRWIRQQHSYRSRLTFTRTNMPRTCHKPHAVPRSHPPRVIEAQVTPPVSLSQWCWGETPPGHPTFGYAGHAAKRRRTGSGRDLIGHLVVETGGGDHHDAHAGHSHALGAKADSRYLRAALLLMVAFMVTEIVIAVLSKSLALISDAGHMLSDVGAIGAALWAIRISARPAAGAWTFGWKRTEILSAAGNGVTLLVMSAVVAFEAIQRKHSDPSGVTLL